MRFLVRLLVAMSLAGCMQAEDFGAPGGEPTDVGTHPRDESKVYLLDGAEAESGWTARTTWPGALYGLDNRPDAGEWHPSGKQAWKGDRSWTFQDDNSGRYHDQVIYDLHVPPVDLTEAKSPSLSFLYRGEVEPNSSDRFSWGLLVDGRLLPLGSTNASARDWKEVVVDLSAHAGGPVELMFRFEADLCGADTSVMPTCRAGSFEGYFMDDVKIAERL